MLFNSQFFLTKISIGIFLFFGWNLTAFSQHTMVGASDFIQAGETFQTSRNCFQLTQARDWSSGSVWFKSPIDLSVSFNMELEIMFGCDDVGGADGIVFVFSPHSRMTGRAGEGMGFSGLKPSLGIEIDTWENEHLGDPPEDHIAIMRDGSVQHYYNLAGPKIIPNVEDCSLHKLGIRWDHKINKLSVHLDGIEELAYEGDIVNEIFYSIPSVYWGVTAATGRYNNRHELCFEQLDFAIPMAESLLGNGFIARLLRGETFILEKLKFDNQSDKIIEFADTDLKQLVKAMEENPNMDIAISGHTDDQGDSESNKTLSLSRAKALADLLIQNGISRDKIHISGKGGDFPVASNETTEGRLQNQRVEIRLFLARA